MPTPTEITLVNVGTFPNYTAGSFAYYNDISPANKTICVSVSGTWVGTLTVYYSPDGNFAESVPVSAIFCFGTQSTGAIPSAANDLFTFQGGPGAVYVVATAWTSGTANVTIFVGPPTGVPGDAGGGDNVTIVGPFPSLWPSAQNVNALAVKASAGTLFSFQACNRNASNRWVWVFDNTAASGTEVAVFLLYAGAIIEIGTEYWGQIGSKFTTGITIGISTSNSAYIAATATDHDISAVAN